jgi:hypothetical protein
MGRYFELIHQTPFSDVYSTFDLDREREILLKFDAQFRLKKRNNVYESHRDSVYPC